MLGQEGPAARRGKFPRWIGALPGRQGRRGHGQGPGRRGGRTAAVDGGRAGRPGRTGTPDRACSRPPSPSATVDPRTALVLIGLQNGSWRARGIRTPPWPWWASRPGSPMSSRPAACPWSWSVCPSRPTGRTRSPAGPSTGRGGSSSRWAGTSSTNSPDSRATSGSRARPERPVRHRSGRPAEPSRRHAMADSDPTAHAGSVERGFPRAGETGTTEEILRLPARTRT